MAGGGGGGEIHTLGLQPFQPVQVSKALCLVTFSILNTLYTISFQVGKKNSRGNWLRQNIKQNLKSIELK